MEKSSFFNSVSGDRQYDAADWAEFFASFIGNGFFSDASSSLQLVPASGMDLTLKPGKAFINGYRYRNTEDLSLTIAAAHGTLPRIDRVVLRWSLTDRAITAEILTGTPASAPTAPELTRDASTYELALADIAVAAGATAITAAAVTDCRLDSTLCGVVAGVINQIDATAFYAQMQASFEQLLDVLEYNLEQVADGAVVAHASSHAAEGADAITPDAIGAAEAPATATALPASGTALTANTIYDVSAAVGTYQFAAPAEGWAHGIFTTSDSPAISFAAGAKHLGSAPAFAASKTYEFDVDNGRWSIQEVVT